MKLIPFFGFAAIVPFVLSAASAEDWSQFRGGLAMSVSAGEPLKASPNGASVAWKTQLPGTGWSQPVVVGNKVFVTTAVSKTPDRPKGMMAGAMDPSTMGRAPAPKDPLQWKLICLDIEKGNILWEQIVAEAIPKYGKHASNTYATETPAASNDAVYVWFGSVGAMAAYDHSGKPLWKKELSVQKLSNDFGTGSSPVLYEGNLFVQLYNDEFAQLVCMDARDGKTLWQADRSAGTAWSTPVLWMNNGAMEIVAAGKGMVIGYDPQTGSEKWRVGGLDTSFSWSVVADKSGLYMGTSSPGSRAPIMAVAPGQKGDLTLANGAETSPAILWSNTKSGAGMPSPIVIGERLYFFGNTATCYNKRDGKELFRARLPGGTLAAGCPVAVGDTIYLINESGKLLVISATSEFKVESEIQIGSADEVFWSTPAIANQSLLVRSSDAIYCLR